MCHSALAKVFAVIVPLTLAALYFTSCATSNSSSSIGPANPGSSGSGAVVDYAAGIGGAGQTSAARFLYAIQVPGGVPIPTKINSDGTLSGAQQHFTTGVNANNPPHAAIDPSGTFLYQAAQPGIYGYTIDRSSGSITQMGNTPFAATENIDSIVVDQLGKFVYAYGGGQVFAYTIQAGTGQLLPVMGSPFGASPPTPTFGPADRMALDQTDKFLYVSTSAGIMAYSINPASGRLTMIAGSPFGVQKALAIVVVPSEHLYASTNTNKGTSTAGIYGYTIDPTRGALTPVSGSPFGSNCGADNMATAVAGKFLFATNCGTYSIDGNTGALQLVTAYQPFIFPGDWAVSDPAGKFLWAITMAQNCFHCDVGVSAYQVDPNTGNLTLVPNSFFIMQNSFSGAIVSLAITQ